MPTFWMQAAGEELLTTICWLLLLRCSAQSGGVGSADKLEIWKRGFLRNGSLHSTWKSAVSSSCLVPVLSASSHRILILEEGKIIAQLKKYPKCFRLFGQTLQFRLSSLFLSAGTNVIEGSLQNIYLQWFFSCLFCMCETSIKPRNNCNSILNIRNISKIQLFYPWKKIFDWAILYPTTATLQSFCNQCCHFLDIEMNLNPIFLSVADRNVLHFMSFWYIKGRNKEGIVLCIQIVKACTTRVPYSRIRQITVL